MQDGSAFDIPGVVSLSWDASSQSVLVTWHGAATAGDFDALLAAEIRALEAHHARNLLADCRRQPPLSAEEQDRADQRWLPAAANAGLKRFAVVLPRHREAAVNVEDRLGRVSREELEVGFFESVDAARTWLSR